MELPRTEGLRGTLGAIMVRLNINYRVNKALSCFHELKIPIDKVIEELRPVYRDKINNLIDENNDRFVAMRKEFDREFINKIRSYAPLFKNKNEFMDNTSDLAPAVFMFYARDGVPRYSYKNFEDFLAQKSLEEK